MQGNKAILIDKAMLIRIPVLSLFQYELEELKGICFAKMYSSITEDNAAEALITADLYRADDVKTAAIEFIRR